MHVESRNSVFLTGLTLVKFLVIGPKGKKTESTLRKKKKIITRTGKKMVHPLRNFPQSFLSFKKKKGPCGFALLAKNHNLLGVITVRQKAFSTITSFFLNCYFLFSLLFWVLLNTTRKFSFSRRCQSYFFFVVVAW